MCWFILASTMMTACPGLFFEALNIPDAGINLGVGSGTHAEQVGRTMMEFE